MNITFEERQLMSLYNTGTRTGLIAALFCVDVPEQAGS